VVPLRGSACDRKLPIDGRQLLDLIGGLLSLPARVPRLLCGLLPAQSQRCVHAEHHLAAHDLDGSPYGHQRHPLHPLVRHGEKLRQRPHPRDEDVRLRVHSARLLLLDRHFGCPFLRPYHVHHHREAPLSLPRQ